MIFQEHTLAPHLTVAENIFLGIEPVRAAGILDNRRMDAETREVLDQHGLPLKPSAPVSQLTRAGKQLVEIARALKAATRLVIMDEPTAMLSRKECDALFRIIKDLRDRGLAVVYISHRLEELGQIADRLTILRDGRAVFSGAYTSLDTAGIIRHMVGREIRELYPPRKAVREQAALEVRDLGDGRQYRRISFVLRKGEILGFAGLVGAGRTALARALFGLEKPAEGTIELNGKPVQFPSAAEAIEAGMAFLTEDRKTTSLFPHLSLASNISISALNRFRKGLALDLAEEARRCRDLIRELQIRALSEREPIDRLSGGNQQKALIARWLLAGSTVMLLDEPTQGVDLGARAEIYRLMNQIAAHGGAILMISSDLLELLGMSHRIAVMRRGEIVAILPAEETNQEEIMRYAALAS
jgi:ABC-type sugar transport system ATPase subunit